MELTSPDNIAKWTIADAASLVQASQAQGDSTQYALNNRQRYDFVWPTSAERIAQLGMVQGSRGYQVNTKSEYLYDNSNWRLAIPYAEFNFPAKSMPAMGGVYTPLGQAAIITASSTSTTFVTAPVGQGQFMITDPGVYGFSVYGSQPSGVGLAGQSAVIISSAAAGTGTQYSRGYFSGGNGTMAPMPFFYVTTANTVVHVAAYNDTATPRDVAAILRIGRFG